MILYYRLMTKWSGLSDSTELSQMGLSHAFGCIVGSFSFTYHGLPLGLTKPLVKDYAPLICRVERRCLIPVLSYAGRLQLVNSVISSLPTYYMCSLKLPATVIEIIDKHRKSCLWRGKDFKKKGYNLSTWDLVRKPKDKGGLGVINLSVQNDALLLKHLDKFYRKTNVPWVRLIWDKYYSNMVPHLAKEKGSFWWRDILRLNIHFRGVAICSPVKGDTISFWGGLINGSILSLVFPSLFEYAKDPNISLWKMMSSTNLIDQFRIPMSRAAFNELTLVQDLMDNFPSPLRVWKILGLSFGGITMPLASFIITPLVKFTLKRLFPGYGSLNVFPKSSSLADFC
jgi:hypothetical protein